MPTRRENWRGKGYFSVTRDTGGRFVHWAKIVEDIISMPFGGKSVTFWGTSVTRYGRDQSRVDLYGGTGHDLYRAIAWIAKHPPRQHYLQIDTLDLLNDPHEYTTEGYWIDKHVDS